MRNWLILLFLSLTLSSCVDTTTTYNRSLTKSKSESDRIYLSFADTKSSSYHFILLASNNEGHSAYLLKVRWTNPDRNNTQFNSMKSTLKFTIDKERIITLMPIKEPIIAAYNLENKTSEEEAVYGISGSQLKDLANAKSVDVELTGKYRVVLAKFNKWQTFRAFKYFLKNS